MLIHCSAFVFYHFWENWGNAQRNRFMVFLDFLSPVNSLRMGWGALAQQWNDASFQYYIFCLPKNHLELPIPRVTAMSKWHHLVFLGHSGDSHINCQSHELLRGLWKFPAVIMSSCLHFSLIQCKCQQSMPYQCKLQTIPLSPFPSFLWQRLKMARIQG